jgi:hypothetical protein
MANKQADRRYATHHFMRNATEELLEEICGGYDKIPSN